MEAKPERDEKLLEFANTPRQREVLEALWETGSATKAAEMLNLAPSSVRDTHMKVRRRAATAGYAPSYDMTHTVPDGYLVRGVSTYYDRDGEVRGQWVKSALDRERQEELFREMVAAFTDELPRLAPSKAPASVAEDLCVGIPVGDLHIGLLAWHEENAGDDYDMEICERLFTGAIDHLLKATPPAAVGLIALLGDFAHTDSHKPVTPTSGHQLDVDSRPSLRVRVMIRLARYAIEAAKDRHAKVRVIVEIGNHDIYTSIFLMEALAAMYERDERVEIDTSPRHYHYFRFGQVLIGTHHGDKRKLADLPLIMAVDRKHDWAASKYRYIWTGHLHHDAVKDVQGVRVEQFRVLPAADAYADEHGYRSMRDIKAIVFHKDHGEVARHTVNPEMLL